MNSELPDPGLLTFPITTDVLFRQESDEEEEDEGDGKRDDGDD
jgi:hypothetical protein